MQNYIKIFLDLDGTICGHNEWKSFIWNTLQLFKTGLNINMGKYPQWGILTARPRIDKPIIYGLCVKYNLDPVEIITSDTWLYKFKNKNEIADWKSSVINNQLRNIFVSRIIYVDNDPEIRSKIINMKNVITCSTNMLSEVIKENKNNF